MSYICQGWAFCELRALSLCTSSCAASTDLYLICPCPVFFFKRLLCMLRSGERMQGIVATRICGHCICTSRDEIVCSENLCSVLSKRT